MASANRLIPGADISVDDLKAATQRENFPSRLPANAALQQLATEVEGRPS
jgi:hypothetical protein